MLSKVADPSTSLLGKIGLGIVLLPVAGLAAAAETIKAVINPQKTFQRCTQFVKYAWQNNSTFLKICSLPLALLATLMSIPAAIQYSVQKVIVEPLTKTTYDRAALLEKQEPVINRVKLTKDKLAEVNEHDPVVALATLQHLLHEHPDKIPVFTPKTQAIVNTYLKNLNMTNPDQVKTMLNYETSVKEIFAKTNDPALPAFSRHRDQPHEVPEIPPIPSETPRSSQRPD